MQNKAPQAQLAPAPAPAPAPSPTPTPAPAANRDAGSETPEGGQSQELPPTTQQDPHAVDTRWFGAAMLGFSTDGLNAGLGLRFGKTLPNHLYVGGSFVYNTGESQTYFPYGGYTGYGVATASASASASLYYVGPEVGYDFAIKSLTLRAYAGGGMAHSTVSYSSSVTTTAGYPYGYAPSVAVSGSTGSTSLGLWPGFSVLYTIPQSMFFVGGDVRLLISTGSSLAEGISNDPALGFFAFGGVKFGS